MGRSAIRIAVAALALGLASCSDEIATGAAAEGDAAAAETSTAQIIEPRARYIVTESRFGFDETLRRLFEALDRRDLTIFAVVDHAAGAQSVDLELPPATLVVFGSPAIGTPLMKAAPVLSAELPLRASVFEDKDGQVKLAMPSMLAIARSTAGLEGESERVDELRGNLAALAAEATGAED